MEKHEFISGLFDELNGNHVPYCVLRGYEGLPFQTGTDIDIFIDGEMDFETILEGFFHKHGFRSYIKNEKDGFLSYVVYRFEEPWFDIQLDFWTSLNYRGIPWISSEIVLSNMRTHGNIAVASKGVEAAILSLKEMFGRGPIKKKYYDRIHDLAADDKKNFVTALIPTLGESITNHIYGLIEQRDFAAIDKMRRCVLRKLKKGHHQIYWKESLSRLKEKRRSKKHNKGLFVAFIGPDGSGKTTLINNIKAKMSLFFSSISRYHMRYNILPELKTGLGISSMKGKVSGEGTSSDKTENKTKTKRSLLSKTASWFVVLYYRFEFILGNKRIKKAKRNNGLVLFDRYFFDHFIQPTSRDLIMRRKRSLLRHIEKPDLLVHLFVDENIVYARKQELNKKEIAQQNKYIKEFVRGLDYAVTIDATNLPPEEVSNQAVRLMLDLLTAKSGKHRHG